MAASKPQRTNPIGLSLLLPLLLVNAPDAEALQLPAAGQLGFSEASFVDPEGRDVKVFVDQQTGWRVKLLFARSGGPLDPRAERIVEIRDEKGVLVEKEETGAFYQLQETAWPSKSRRELRWLGESAQLIRSDWVDGTWKASPPQTLPSRAFEADCWSPISMAELDQRLASIKPLLVAANPSVSPNHVDVGIGPNMTANSCGEYGVTGESSLAADVQDAFDRGLRCMAELANWEPAPGSIEEHMLKQSSLKGIYRAYWRAQAARLLGLFSAKATKKFKFTCARTSTTAGYLLGLSPFSSDESHALAAFCDETDGPGMALNLNYFNKASRAERLSTLFHELVHETGKLHDISGKKNLFDAVYGMEFCCFGTPGRIKGKADPVRDPFACAQVLTQPHGTPL